MTKSRLKIRELTRAQFIRSIHLNKLMLIICQVLSVLESYKGIERIVGSIYELVHVTRESKSK